MSLLKPALIFTLSSLVFPVAAEPATAPEFIDTFAKIFGEHPGARKGHAKGFCIGGDFQGTAAIQTYSSSALFSGDTYPLLGRFSMAGGNPKAAENSRSPRGLALQIKLNNGELQHFALLSTPMFGAKDPESFLGLLKTLIPGADGKPDMAKVAAYRAAHPDTQAQAKYLADTAPPASYASTPYFGLHSFMLSNKTSQQQAVRWQLQPVDGVKGLTAAEIAAKPTEFLQQRLAERLKQGPVQFKLELVLAEAGDNLLDPSVQWPASRKTLQAGTVTLRSQGDNACDNINFDPNVLSAGISPSADPILAMRSAAYAISFGKRLTGH
ncbi:MAG: catalase family peroxidase [Rheinheimera sp.]|nr:catalase family peroxidase [Rheinheimera sp.]